MLRPHQRSTPTTDQGTTGNEPSRYTRASAEPGSRHDPVDVKPGSGIALDLFQKPVVRLARCRSESIDLMDPLQAVESVPPRCRLGPGHSFRGCLLAFTFRRTRYSDRRADQFPSHVHRGRLRAAAGEHVMLIAVVMGSAGTTSSGDLAGALAALSRPDDGV